jgi:Cu(I)/Ag(I) efflux system protein CusF
MPRLFALRNAIPSKPARIAVVFVASLLGVLLSDAGSVVPWLAGDVAASSRARAQAADISGTGMINSINSAQRKVNMSHDAIPELKWPSMTMDFSVSTAVDLSKLKPGTKVKFSLERGSGGYVLQAIRPAQ